MQEPQLSSSSGRLEQHREQNSTEGQQAPNTAQIQEFKSWQVLEQGI